MNSLIFKALPLAVLFIVKAVTMTGQISYFHGRIMEGDIRWPVYRVLVQNVSSHRWTSSDTSGCFHLPAAAGDTLVFSASEYDLMVMIARKYEEFLRVKKGMGSDRKGMIQDDLAVQIRDE